MSSIGILVIAPFHPAGGLSHASVAITGARAGAIGILDGEHISDDEGLLKSAELLAANCMSGKIGLRFRCGQFGVVRNSITALAHIVAASEEDWSRVVVIAAGPSRFEKATLENEISLSHNAGFQVIVETIDLQEALLAQSCGADAVIAKGHESGGRVGPWTSFVLIQQYVNKLAIPSWAQGGIGLHTVSAVAAAGAAGIVLDSQLLLCRDAQVPPALQLRLSRFDGTETTLVDGPGGISFRFYSSRQLTRDQVKSQESFADLMSAKVIGAGEIWPIGQDACFASSIAARGGTIAGALDALREAAQENLQAATKFACLSEGSPLATAHATRYPIVQGAMTRVSDTSEFARNVADGGALPFLALSLMRGAEIETLLSETSAKLSGQSWGVGLLGFIPPQLRQEQLEVVGRYRPPFALIAGGRPDQAKALEDAGTICYLHVPSPSLLKSFAEMGARRFIFEGKECGGHVGPRSSFVLWESMITTLLEAIGPREDASLFHVLFAGGIHDDLSAAMVAALAAPLSIRGIKVGVLVGTAYLFTEEAVSSGAIVKKFQEAAIECNETVLLETGAGHSIRCIESPYKEVFDQRREHLQQENRHPDEVREELELMNLGRLRVASKGLARVDSTKLSELSDEQQWRDGMYMIGQVAALHEAVTTINTLHSTISAGGQQVLLNRAAQQASEDCPAEQSQEGIAIVGMSCMFPQANDVEQYWQNILNKVDAITEIPATHFDWQKYYDPDPQAPDKIVSKWGGFLSDIVFEPGRYGIPPSSLEAIDPIQILILEAAREALEDAGYTQRKFPRKRTSVIVANAGHGPITVLYSLRSMLGWKLDHLDPDSKEYIESELPKWTEDSFAGYLGNVIAGRVANRFDLGGVNFAIDAACASSLAALYVGMAELRSKASDVVLLGASDTHNQPGDYLSFSKTHALSPHGKCKTFDVSADGIAISEGVAMIVLKRLSDAERDGDKIYAVIRGIGGSSDGRDFSLTAPRADGQVVALERAYADAGLSPATIELVEAHGTGTVAGDKAEVQALTKVYSKAGASPENCAIGSVKTNIGHTKAAAGLASVIKIAKSLHHKVIPPTINVNQPSPACKFGEGPFYLNTEARPWINPTTGTPRRAAVSAFGFGGTNFHAVLEEYEGPLPDSKPATDTWPAELFVWRANSAEQLVKALNKTEKDIQSLLVLSETASTARSGEKRHLFELATKVFLKSLEGGVSDAVLSIVATSLEDLSKKIRQATDKVKLDDTQAFDLPQIHYARAPISQKTCFLFPGQGSQKIDMLKDLSMYFPEVRKTIEAADEAFSDSFPLPLSKYIYPPTAFSDEQRKLLQGRLTQTEIAQPAMGVCDLAILRVLQGLGMSPDMVAGHSYGEFVALHAAGVITEQELLQISAQRGRLLSGCATEHPGSMAAVMSDENSVAKAIKGIPNLFIANMNAPQQVIISGAKESIEAATTLLLSRDIPCKKLPVSAAFHTPFMDPAKKALKLALQKIDFKPSTIQTFSNLTAAPHATKPAALIDQLTDHIVQPVKFAQQLRAMYDAGARIFVEVGPGSALTGMVKSTLKDVDVLAVATDSSGKDGLSGFLDALACLLANGVHLDYGKLFWNRMDLAAAAKTSESTHQPGDRLLYRVNSVRMERVTSGLPGSSEAQRKSLNAAAKQSSTNHRNGSGEQSSSNNGNGSGQQSSPQQALASAMPMFEMPQANSASIAAGGNVEHVMLQFQQNMLQMTNRFLETQQQVMLAYLNSQNGVGTPSEFQPVDFAQVQAQLQPDAAQQFVSSQDQSKTDSQGQSKTDSNVVGEQECLNGADSADGTDALIEKLFEIVSERTGYPTEMLDPGLDMEADLGIDSIKRIEILNTFRKLLPARVQETLEGQLESLAGTKTLQGIVDWLRAVDEPTDGVDSDAPKSTEAASVPGNEISRGIPVISELARATSTTEQLVGTVVIVSDATGTAEAVAAKLQQSGHKSVIVEHRNGEQNGPHRSADLTDPESVAVLVASIKQQHGSIGALIYLSSTSETLNSLKSLFLMCKQLEPDLKQPGDGRRTALLTTTALGGKFGIGGLPPKMQPADVAEQAAINGFIKSVSKEWSRAHVKTLDVGSHNDLDATAQLIVGELFADDQIVEVGFTAGKRLTVEVAPAEFPSGGKAHNAALIGDKQLDSSSIVLVTGGARGITAAITLQLARKYKCNFVIVGRQLRPSQRESENTLGLTTAKELKSAIMDELRVSGQPVNIRDVERRYQLLLKEREIRSNLSELQSSGAKVKYCSMDVADERSFGDFIDSVYDTYGDIDTVIHGAGIIEDALLTDKSWDSFERVFKTKVNAASTLLKHLRFESLKHLCFFSSVVGRTGNAGQSDYAAANEALNKLALYARSKAMGGNGAASNGAATDATRVCSLMWGPWDGGMAPPELKEAFAEYGWSMINPSAGAASFIQELQFGRLEEVEVLQLGTLQNGEHIKHNASMAAIVNVKPKGVLLGRATLEAIDPPTFRVSIDSRDHRYLLDHKIDGIPVMPMAAALELMIETASLIYPNKRPAKISDLDIPAGIMFDGPEKEVCVRVIPGLGGRPLAAAVQIESAGSAKKVHYRCEIDFQESEQANRKQISSAEKDLLEFAIDNSIAPLPVARELYGKWLFHGPIFQGMRAITAMDDRGITGQVSGRAPRECVESASTNPWIVDPILFDSAMQLAGMWARYHFDITVLPTGFRAMHLFDVEAAGELNVRVRSERGTSTELQCDLGVYDSSGNPVLIVEGLHGVGSKSFNRFATHADVAELAR